MKNSKKFLGIFGSAAIVLMVGVLQSSVHAAPMSLGVGVMPTASIAVPAATSQSSAGQLMLFNRDNVSLNQTPANAGVKGTIDWAGVLERTPVFARIAGQMLLGIYGLSLMAGRNANGATRSKANLIWGATFIGIALAAPELINWLVQNSPSTTPEVGISRGGCG